MRGKTNQDLTSRHSLKPNLTWSITDGRLRRKDVDSKYVQSMKSLLKNTKRRFIGVIGRLEWAFSIKGIKERHSQYIHFAPGDSNCNPPDDYIGCPYPRKGCSTCEFHVVYEPYEPTRLGFLREELVGQYQILLKAIGCFIHGHDLCDVGYGGPESGNMDHECQRCDEYWSVPLY